MSGTRGRIARPVVAAVVVLAGVLASVPASNAAPSKAQVEAAKAKLADLQRTTDLLVEQYDQARIQLDQTRTKLAELRKEQAAAEAAYQKAKDDLQRRAVAAYTGAGSELDAVLGATSFTELSDRLQYMGALAQGDADLAQAADTAGTRAQWAKEQVAQTLQQETAQRDNLQNRISDIKDVVAQQQALYAQLNRDYQAALRAERLAEQQAQQVVNDSGSGSGGGGSYSGPPPPPPNTSAAQTAIYYARSVIGASYVWGSADPNVGFDCSGLVMWSYAHAGVSLPHSSAGQAAMMPHVAQADLQPGDLLFFYSPVSHVGLYVGGGKMIDASHPGPGGGVAERTVYWSSFDYGGRPT